MEPFSVSPESFSSDIYASVHNLVTLSKICHNLLCGHVDVGAHFSALTLKKPWLSIPIRIINSARKLLKTAICVRFSDDKYSYEIYDKSSRITIYSQIPIDITRHFSFVQLKVGVHGSPVRVGHWAPAVSSYLDNVCHLQLLCSMLYH